MASAAIPAQPDDPDLDPAHGAGRVYQAVSLDVGGVLVVPDHGMLSTALARAGVDHDRSRFGEGHYRAMAAVDRAASDPEDFTDYARAFLDVVTRHRPGDRATVGAGAGPGQQDGPGASAADDRARTALLEVLATPVWCQPVPGARAGLRALVAAGLRLAVTSNSDGSVADMLRRHEWAQVGPGPGVEVEVITDSGLVGVGKPDPRMFGATSAGLGLAPDQVLHIGDSVHYDVAGARAAGMGAVHMDPHGICGARDHPHVATLADVVGLVTDRTAA